MATNNSSDTYVSNLIELLRPYSSGLSRQQVMSKLARIRELEGHSIPPAFEEAVQSVFNRHCNQSEISHAPEEGFFNSTHDGNNAIWSLDVDRATAWLRTQSPHYLLAQAIARIKEVSIEKALDAIDNADESKLKKCKNNVKVKAVIAQIRAEKAVEAAERE